MGFVADVVGGVADAVGGVVGGVADAVGGVVDALGPIAPLAAMAIPGAGLLGSLSSIGEVGGLFGPALLDTAAVDAGGVLAGYGMGNAALDAALVAGESAGIPSTVGGLLGGANTIGNLAKVGMNLYSAMNVPKGQSPQQAQTAAAPYSPYAAQAAADLNKLVANPASLTSTAGYQAGLQAQQQTLQRQLAQTGQSQSGLAGYSSALSAGTYFSDYYNQQYNKLSQLAGATPQNLIAGQGASQQAAIQQQNAKATQMQYLNAALGGLFGGQQQQTSYWG